MVNMALPLELTNVILLDVLNKIHQCPKLQAAFVELTDIQQEYSHNYLFIFKSKKPQRVWFDDLMSTF